MPNKDTYILTCHCRSVEIELNLPDGLKNVLRCNCSICKKRSAIVALVDDTNLKIVKGEDKLSLYQFHTFTAKHYFCSKCGIYTHHNTRSNPKKYGFNLSCVEGIDSYNVEDIRNFDGINHPLDK